MAWPASCSATLLKMEHIGIEGTHPMCKCQIGEIADWTQLHELQGIRAGSAAAVMAVPSKLTDVCTADTDLCRAGHLADIACQRGLLKAAKADGWPTGIDTRRLLRLQVADMQICLFCLSSCQTLHFTPIGPSPGGALSRDVHSCASRCGLMFLIN